MNKERKHQSTREHRRQSLPNRHVTSIPDSQFGAPLNLDQENSGSTGTNPYPLNNSLRLSFAIQNTSFARRDACDVWCQSNKREEIRRTVTPAAFKN
jgi:hypothetical protein